MNDSKPQKLKLSLSMNETTKIHSRGCHKSFTAVWFRPKPLRVWMNCIKFILAQKQERLSLLEPLASEQKCGLAHFLFLDYFCRWIGTALNNERSPDDNSTSRVSQVSQPLLLRNPRNIWHFRAEIGRRANPPPSHLVREMTEITESGKRAWVDQTSPPNSAMSFRRLC